MARSKVDDCGDCGGELGEPVVSETSFIGLPDLTIAGITRRTCTSCLGESITYPNMSDLLSALALAFVAKPSRLTGAEFKLLRNHLEWGSEEAAHRLGVALETLSRWEHGHQPVNAIADRFVRALVLAQESMPGAVDLLDLDLPGPAVPLRAVARWDGKRWTVEAADSAVRNAMIDAERRYRTPATRVA